jgi:hypothetical protein
MLGLIAVEAENLESRWVPLSPKNAKDCFVTVVLPCQLSSLLITSAIYVVDGKKWFEIFITACTFRVVTSITMQNIHPQFAFPISFFLAFMFWTSFTTFAGSLAVYLSTTLQAIRASVFLATARFPPKHGFGELVFAFGADSCLFIHTGYLTGVRRRSQVPLHISAARTGQAPRRGPARA